MISISALKGLNNSATIPTLREVSPWVDKTRHILTPKGLHSMAQGQSSASRGVGIELDYAFCPPSSTLVSLSPAGVRL